MSAPPPAQPALPSSVDARRATHRPAERGATFWVLERNLPELQRRFGALDRRAQRLGTGPLALHDTGERDGDRARVLLAGEPPALAGWVLAAVVEHGPAESAVRVVTAEPLPLDPKRFEQPRCDHCGLRRRRTETFVVWHAQTRRRRQVGSDCLRDFLGGHDPERLCRQAEYHVLAQRELRCAAALGPTDAPKRGVALDDFAAHAAHTLRAHG
jgi:hypothetical protein